MQMEYTTAYTLSPASMIITRHCQTLPTWSTQDLDTTCIQFTSSQRSGNSENARVPRMQPELLMQGNTNDRVHIGGKMITLDRSKNDDCLTLEIRIGN